MSLRGRGPGADRAQVAAIAAVLTLALVVIALAVTQATVVPQQNERVEFDHQQEVRQDMQNVREAVLGSASTASGQTATLRLGTTYPERIILQNPGPAQGNLVVEGIGVGSISNAVAADNRETTDFWSGTVRSGYVNGRVRFVPGYNYYENAPESVYESSVTYRNRSGEVTMQSGQSFVDGRTLSLAFLDGDRRTSNTGTATIQPRTLSASQVDVDLQSPNAEPLVLRVPTRLPRSAWDDLLADEYDPSGSDPDAYVRSYSCTATSPDAPCGVLTLRLEPGATYDVKLSKVGLKGSIPEPAAYLTAVEDPDPIDEGKTRQFTVQVRDRYNNPVSGVELGIVQPSVGRVVGPVNSVGEVGAVTDDDGRATFVYRAPLNVPGDGATATLGVEAPGIPGEKGRVAYDIGIRNTPEPVDGSRVPPLVTAVNPDVSDGDVADGGGDYVRVTVTRPGGVDTTNQRLDLVNRDGSVRNTVVLDRELEVLDTTVDTDGELYFVNGTANALADEGLLVGGALPTTVELNDVLDGSADVYVVGPNAYSGDGTTTDLSAFADHYGLDADGEGPAENDIVVRAGALQPDSGVSLVDGSLDGGFSDADPNGDDDGTVDIVDDARGTVLLRDGSDVLDAFAYRTDGGRITAVAPAGPRGASTDEHVRLDFDRPTDLNGADDAVGGDGSDADYTLSVSGDGRRETVGLGPVADRIGDGAGEVIGPVYVVGDGVDAGSFAADRGVSPDRVFRAATLVDDGGLADGDLVPDGGGVARLRDGPPGTGTEVDERTYEGVRRVHIEAVAPVDATEPAGPQGATPTVSADEFARLEFGTTVDTTSWALTVDDGVGTETLDLTPLAGTTARAPGPVFLLGQVDVNDDGSIDGDDRRAFARARGLTADRVFFAADLTDGPGPTDAFDDGGAALTLRDVAGDTVDTYTYGGVREAAIGPVAPNDATGVGGATDEFLRLDIGPAFDSTGWTLTVENGAGTTEGLDLGVSEVRDTVGAGEDVYFVGDAVDADRFATDRGIDPSQVVRFRAAATGGLADTDVLDDGGATLRLADERDRTVGTYAYDASGAAGVTSVEPSVGGDAAAEFARLDFAGTLDTTAGQGWRIRVRDATGGTDGTYDLSGTAISDAAAASGPVYLVGDGLDPDGDGTTVGAAPTDELAAFAEARGIGEDRVFRFTALRTSGSGDALPDAGGDLLLEDGASPRVTVDSAAWTGGTGARIGAVGADTDGDLASDGDADDRLRLEFPAPVDTTGWTVDLDDATPTGGPGPVTLDLTAAAGAARAGDSVYVVGDYNDADGVTADDADDYADDNGLADAQVFTTEQLGAADDAEVLADAGGTVTLRDGAGDAVDTVAYGSELRSGRIATVDPVDATAGAGPSDEFVRLAFDRPVDTTGYDLSVRRPAAGDVLSVPLDDAAPVLRRTGGPVYLVGDAVDADAFAARERVSTDRVLVLDGSGSQLGAVTPSDILTDGGAELVLRGDLDDDGTAETELDRYGYGTERPRTGDWEHTFGGDTDDRTAYRDRDGDGRYLDTNDGEDWFDSDAAPGDGPTAAEDAVTVEGVTTTGRDADGDGAAETTGVEVAVSTGGSEVRVVAFATDTDLAASVDNGAAGEATVPVTSTNDSARSGYANDTVTGAAGSFAADGTVYPLSDGAYGGRDAVVPAGSTFSLGVEEYRTSDGDVAGLGTLAPSRAADADLSLTLVFDDGSTETVHLRQRPADIEVNATVDREIVSGGETVTYTVSARNLGPGDAPGPVRLADDYDPDRLTFERASPDAGTYDPSTGVWTLPSGLAAGETTTLNVTFRANGSVGDALPYTAARTTSGAPDPDAGNDVATAAAGIGGADLELALTSPADGNGDGVVAAEAGAELRFDLTVTNDGPADVPGTVEVTDELPGGLTYVGSSTSAGSYDPDTGVWSFPGPEAGASESLTVTATVTDRSNTTARITDLGSADDPDRSNNADGIQVVAGPCTTFPDPGETVLLYSTFETDGADDADRLENAGWTASSPGVGGVDNATAASPTADCDQSAYHADGGANGDGAGGSAAITSPTVDTRGYGLIEASYWVRPGADEFSDPPEAGEDLLVQYNNSAGEWVTVDRFEASNGSLAEGVRRTVYLPGSDVKHEGFRLRFQQVAANVDRTDDGAGTNDVWHVDNVELVGGPRDDGSLRPVLNDVVVDRPADPTGCDTGAVPDGPHVEQECVDEAVYTAANGSYVYSYEYEYVYRIGSYDYEYSYDYTLVTDGDDTSENENENGNEDGDGSDYCVADPTPRPEPEPHPPGEFDAEPEPEPSPGPEPDPAEDCTDAESVDRSDYRYGFDHDYRSGLGETAAVYEYTYVVNGTEDGANRRLSGRPAEAVPAPDLDPHAVYGSPSDVGYDDPAGTFQYNRSTDADDDGEDTDSGLSFDYAYDDGDADGDDEDYAYEYDYGFDNGGLTAAAFDYDGDDGSGDPGGLCDAVDCSFDATFGYESTYDAPVFVDYAGDDRERDDNRFSRSDIDGSDRRLAGENATVADGPGDDGLPARPERFTPGRHDGTTAVTGFGYESALTYYLPADTVTAYGLVTDYRVAVRLNDDTRGSVLQGQYLEYGVRIGNSGGDGTPDSGPTGRSARIRLREGVTDVDRLTITTRDGSDPVVLDATRGDARDDLVTFDPVEGADPVGETDEGEGATAVYDPETNVVTVGGLPDPGEPVWVNVSTRLPADDADPVTVDAALTYRQTADPVPGNDADSVTVDPRPIDCRGTVHQDGSELVLTQPRPATTGGGRVAQVRTFGTLETSTIRLGPYRDVDGDEECEVVYLREGGIEGQVMVMNPNGSTDPKTDVLASDADLSNTVLTTSDRDDDDLDEVYYARNDEQALRYVEVRYGAGEVSTRHRGFVKSDGENVSSDSGVFTRADTDDDGSVETFYVASRTDWGVIEDGSTIDNSGGVPFNAGYPRNATGAADLPPGIPYGEGPAGLTGGRGADIGAGLGLMDAAGADPIAEFDGSHGGGRVTMRDADYDGEYEIVYVDGSGSISYYNLPATLTENYQDDQTVTLVDASGDEVSGGSGQGVQ